MNSSGAQKCVAFNIHITHYWLITYFFLICISFTVTPSAHRAEWIDLNTLIKLYLDLPEEDLLCFFSLNWFHSLEVNTGSLHCHFFKIFSRMNFRVLSESVPSTTIMLKSMSKLQTYFYISNEALRFFSTHIWSKFFINHRQ